MSSLVFADHDPMLLCLALTICAGSVVSAFKTYRLSFTAPRRDVWLFLAGLNLAGGIWGMHFVSMLAYETPVAASFVTSTAALSLLIAFIAAWAGLALASGAERHQGFALAGGAVIGAGIAGMHYIGIGSWNISADLDWTPWLVAVSVVAGVGLAAASVWTFMCRPEPRAFWAASALMMLAISSLHFIGISAFTLILKPGMSIGEVSLNRPWVAATVALLSALCFGCGIIATTVERLRRRLDEQVASLKAEVEERRRMQSELKSRESRLLAHQTSIAELMKDDKVRAGTLEQAMRHVMAALARGLGVERAGILLLDRDKRSIQHKEIYIVAEDAFVVPPHYGSEWHLDVLKRSSSKDVVAVDDVSVGNSLDELRELFFDKHGIRSALHAPIIAHGDLVGFMTCTNVSRTMAWTAEQRVFALSIANLAAVVVERHQRLAVEAAVQASADRLAAQQKLLNSLIVSERLLNGKVAELFEDVAEVMCREMRVDRVSVRFFAGSGFEAVHTEVFLGNENRLVAVARDPKRKYPSVLSNAIASGPLVVDDCSTHPATMKLYDTRLRPRRIRAMLHVPILNENRLIGVIACSMYDTARRWRSEDILLASGIANVFALASERRLRLQTEDSLRKANEVAEEASRAKSLFLANMSHEIRTPMNGVLGMADLLSRSGLNERQHRIASTITESAQSLLAIINDILDISRIEGGKLQLDKLDFDLGACVEDAVELMSEQANRKSLDLNLFIDDRVRGDVACDPVRLRQVLLNLIGNAIKFTAEGEVSVLVQPAPDSHGPGVRFEVRDTGIGIVPELQAKLFQPFTQADTSITRRFGGTGLGLSISRHLVELMGGRIGLESAPGQGAMIWFVLPLDVRRNSHGMRQDPVGLAARRILVVDDRSTNREIVSSYMAASGALVEAVDGADAAMSRLAAAIEAGRPFDLAIVDFIMPNCDGIELCRRIFRQTSTSNVKLMLLSSIAWSDDLGDAKAAGIVKILHKPIRRDELVTAALTCLEQGGGHLDSDERTVADALSSLDMDVLIAEDNPVNQVVAEEYLAHMGCRVTIVDNGLQAVDASERMRFDVVLMDCQMPEMDGYSATRAIRMRETETGAERLPIVAVTANAYEADRQRCLEAGMDDYVSKPYSEAQLAAALRKFGRTRGWENPPLVAASEVSGAEQEQTSPPSFPKEIVEGEACAKERGSHSDVAPVHATTALSRQPAIAPVRPQLREKLMATYVRHLPASLQTLRGALSGNDAAAIALVAHSLKSSSANVGLDDIAQLAAQLEQTAKARDMVRCGPIAQCIIAGCEQVMAAREPISNAAAV